MNIIKFFNTNEGFISAILSTLSILFSIIAVIISTSISKKQTQVMLFERRLKIYSEFHKAYEVCSQFIKIAKNVSYLHRCQFAYILLFDRNSEEFKICGQIQSIRFKEEQESNMEQKKLLKEKWMKKAEELMNPYIVFSQNIEIIKREFHLLYSNDIEQHLVKLIDSYVNLYLSHPYWTNGEYDMFISETEAIINDVKSCKIIEKLEKETLSKKRYI